MTLRSQAAAAAAIFAVSVATSATAAVFVTTTPGPDAGPAAGETFVIDFNTGLPVGVELNDNGFITSGDPGHAAPLGDTTPFFATPATGNSGSSEIRFADFLGGRDVTHFSLYWGSIDSFNTLQLFNRAANQIVTLSGATLIGAAANGSPTDPQANRRVYFTLTGSSRDLGSLRFTSIQPTFEADTLAFATVPEPATWITMLLGFASLGAALRRRRAHATAAG